MAQEHQEYIQTKVNPILENLVTQVLLERPDNPVPFMVRWLANQSPQAKDYFAGFGAGEAEKLRNEVRSLQDEVRSLETKLGRAPAVAPPAAAAAADKGKPAKKDKDEEEEEEEDDDDDAPDVPVAPPPSYLNKGPRTSVSAEAYGDWNKIKAFTPPVHAKTEEQKQRILAVIDKSFLFSALDKKNLDIIIGAMVEKPGAKDERLIQEGDDGDCMYIIEKGTCVCKKKIQGEDKVVKTCGAGDIFGELALLYNCPRAASVEAVDDVVLWKLDRETFNHIVRDASMKKRQMYEEFLKCVKLLKDLGDYDRSQLADSLRKESFPAGAEVIKQGEDGDRFYLVEEGELVALKSTGSDEPKEVMTYKRGDYFGELALLKEDKRQATVVTRTPSQLLWTDRRGFKSLLGPLEDKLKTNATAYAP